MDSMHRYAAAGTLCALLALAWGCTGPEPAPPGPEDPLLDTARILKENVERKKTGDPASLAARLRTLAPRDPEDLLAVLQGTDLVVENAQSQLTDRELEMLGEPKGAERDLPILQRVVLDGGDGLFVLAYLHRLRSAGAFESGPGAGPDGGKKGDVVAIQSRLLDARFLPFDRVFDADRARAFLQSPDWRVAAKAPSVLVREGFRGSAGLDRYALDFLDAGDAPDERTGVLLEWLGARAPAGERSDAASASLAARIVQAYLDWLEHGGDDPTWRDLFTLWTRAASDPDRSPSSAFRYVETGLGLLGHGSPFPALATSGPTPSGTPGAAVPHPRTYVRAFSPRLTQWAVEILEGPPDKAFPLVLALLAGADPYLKVQFSEHRKHALAQALLAGLATAPVRMRLLAALVLENLTGCTFPEYDPFAGDEARAAALARMERRFERTKFEGLDEEHDRRRRLLTARKALETVAFLQRRRREEHGRYASDPVTLFGSVPMAAAAGIEAAGDGMWTLKGWFAFKLSAAGARYEAVLEGPVHDGDPPTRLRLRSELGVVEILPGG